MTENYLTQRMMEGQSARPDGPRGFRGGRGIRSARKNSAASAVSFGAASLDRDVFSNRAGCRNGIAVRAHAFQVKFNRLADEVLHLIQRLASRAEARQIGSVCAPARV